MQTNQWGRSAWTFLGAVAYEYPEREVSEERRRATAQAIESLQHITPCPHCRASLVDFLREDPPQLRDRASLTAWLYALHNKVNDKLRRQYFAFYDDPLNAQCNVVGTCTKAPCAWRQMPRESACADAYPRVPWSCLHTNPTKEQVDAEFEAMRAGCGASVRALRIPGAVSKAAPPPEPS